MKRYLPISALLLAGLAAPPALEAQQLPERGDWSIALQLFNSDIGTVFGLWRMMTDRLSAGVEVDWRRADTHESVFNAGSGITLEGDATIWQFTVGPSVKLYGSREGPVSPYLRSKVSIGWDSSFQQTQNSIQRDEKETTFQISLAVGAEWYPIRQLAIGGHTGFQWSRAWFDRAENDSTTVRDRVTDNLGTFRSGLELHFYFR